MVEEGVEAMEAAEEEVSKNPETGESIIPEAEAAILSHLTRCKDVFFKSQQRGERDLTPEEKQAAAQTVLRRSKSNFLERFGKHLQPEHLDHFQQFVADESDGYAVAFHLEELRRRFSRRKRAKDVRNRRYAALRDLVDATTSASSGHFSETEMMRRNPLLYHQLVGQYLSAEEKKLRDNIDTANITFVNLLLETIDRDSLRSRHLEQQQLEECAMEEDDASEDDDPQVRGKNAHQADAQADSDSWDEEPVDTVTKWGEFPGSSTSYVSAAERTRKYEHFFANSSSSNGARSKDRSSAHQEAVLITATERRLLKEEFISAMYQEFLDGKDQDFDYSSVDDNDAYDNLDLKTHDAEDAYFDSETPEDKDILPVDDHPDDDDADDALEVFMSRLNKHPTIQQLSDKMHQL